VLTSSWSYNNKGDAVILESTMGFLRTVFHNVRFTLITIDYESFLPHKENLGRDCTICRLPIPTALNTILSGILGTDDNRDRGAMSNLLYWISGISYLRWISGLMGITLLISLGILTVTFRTFDPTLKAVLRRIHEADLVVAIGGGYAFSNLGAFLYLYPIAYATTVARKRVIFLGHSIGSLLDPFSRLITRVLLEKAAAVVLREKFSYDYAREFLRVRNENILLSNDMAFLLAGRNHLLTGDRKQLGPKAIGINIRKWFFHDQPRFENYFQSIVEAVEYLARTGYAIHLLPFSYVRGRENDLDLSQVLMDSLSSDVRDVVKITQIRDLSTLSIVKLLEDLNISYVIGTRVHSNILSWLADVPTICISYLHFITHGLARQTGLEEYLVNIEDVSTDILLQKAKRLEENKDAITKDLRERTSKMKRAMMAQLVPLLNAITSVKNSDGTRPETARQTVSDPLHLGIKAS